MLMGLKESVTERYASLLAELPQEQAAAWVENKTQELSIEAEQISYHAQQQLQREWAASHNNQQPDFMSQVAINQQADQIAHDTILGQLWEGYEPAADETPRWTEEWPNVPYMPNDATTDLVEHLWPDYQDNLDFMVLAEKLIDARRWDGLLVPEEPQEPLTRELEARVREELAREAAAKPQQN